LFAASILAARHPAIGTALDKFRAQQTDAVLQNSDPKTSGR
jgi:phosphoribosylcarboxyaminoimidazole (NCAIR) mutase